jgi:hypothetical protein
MNGERIKFKGCFQKKIFPLELLPQRPVGWQNKRLLGEPVKCHGFAQSVVNEEI